MGAGGDEVRLCLYASVLPVALARGFIIIDHAKVNMHSAKLDQQSV